MTTLLIIGTGGFAKEVEFVARKMNFEKIFFISNNNDNIDKLLGHSKIIGNDDWCYNCDNNYNFAIGNGTPVIREYIVKNYSAKIYNFINRCPNIIDPNIILDDHIKIGKGNIITAGVQMTIDITIGNFNIFNLNSTVGHDTIIGNYNVFNPSTNISGSITIGNCNLIGTGAQILEKLIIGNNNIIGGGAVLVKNINEDNKIFMGIPAKEKL